MRLVSLRTLPRSGTRTLGSVAARPPPAAREKIFAAALTSTYTVARKKSRIIIGSARTRRTYNISVGESTIDVTSEGQLCGLE